MNREIKFRAWDTRTNKWYFSANNPFGEGEFAWPQPTKERPVPILEDGRQPEGVVLMQYTGLKDKNGKEIYEGDVLKDYGEVVWVAPSASFRVNPSRQNSDISFTESFANIDSAEIIGNIYENPELLQ